MRARARESREIHSKIKNRGTGIGDGLDAASTERSDASGPRLVESKTRERDGCSRLLGGDAALQIFYRSEYAACVVCVFFTRQLRVPHTLALEASQRVDMCAIASCC